MVIAAKPEINLGTIPSSLTTKFTYELTNTGTKTVNPTLSFGCGSCTTGHLSKTSIAPGETILLNVSFKPASKGLNIKTVTVSYTYDNSIWQALKLRFTADVI